VTEVDIYFPKVQTACDCISLCLDAPTTCTNWVWKHTNMPALDSGRRSCTLYSSPNLPSGVTLDYNLALSSGFQLLQAANNPNWAPERQRRCWTMGTRIHLVLVDSCNIMLMASCIVDPCVDAVQIAVVIEKRGVSRLPNFL
jgi:hypothetical protein